MAKGVAFLCVIGDTRSSLSRYGVSFLYLLLLRYQGGVVHRCSIVLLGVHQQPKKQMYLSKMIIKCLHSDLLVLSRVEALFLRELHSPVFQRGI